MVKFDFQIYDVKLSYNKCKVYFTFCQEMIMKKLFFPANASEKIRVEVVIEIDFQIIYFF